MAADHVALTPGRSQTLVSFLSALNRLSDDYGIELNACGAEGDSGVPVIRATFRDDTRLDVEIYYHDDLESYVFEWRKA